MKIYMPKHSVKSVDTVQLKDIPLAYINTTDQVKDIDVDISVECSKDTVKPVRAYDYVSDPEQIFYKSDGTPIREANLRRSGNAYVYEPQGMSEYTPTHFSVTALIKRHMTYSHDTTYNLRVSVIEDSDKEEMSSSMIRIFGDAYKRGIAPSNIIVNNGETSLQSLASGLTSDMDFLFVRSKDGVRVSTGDDSKPGDMISEILDKHVNVWMSTDTFDGMMTSGVKEFVFDNDNKKVAVKPHVLLDKSILYDKTSYEQTCDSVTVFSQNSINNNFPMSKYRYIYIGDSILVLEKMNGAYLIVTPSFLLQDLNTNVGIVYEIMMRVFLNGYQLSDKASSWITDEPVDYMAYYANKLGLHHEKISLNSLVQNTRADIGSAYNLVRIDIDPDNKVSFKKMLPSGELLFEKVDDTTDPKKLPGEISFLTTKGTIINYRQEDVNIVESKLKIDTTVVDNIGYITIHPYASSSLRVHSKKDQTLTIKDPGLPFLICALPSTPDTQSVYQLVLEDQYSIDKHGCILAKAVLTSKSTTKLYDVSIRGGGLPESEPDDYNLIDIGNTYGRPYRKGSTMIIRLPEKCKEYDDVVKDAIMQHIASGEYPVVIYEKQGGKV